MREGNSDNNSENPDDSVDDLDEDFAESITTAEYRLKEIMNGCTLTWGALRDDLLNAAHAYRCAIAVADNKTSSTHLAALYHLLETNAAIMVEDGSRLFAQAILREADTIAEMASANSMASWHPREMEAPAPKAVVVEPPNSNHLLDISHL